MAPPVDPIVSTAIPQHFLESLLSDPEFSHGLVAHDGPPVFKDHANYPSITEEAAQTIDRRIAWQDAVSIAFLILENSKAAHTLTSMMENEQNNLLTYSNRKIGIVESLRISAMRNPQVAHVWELKLYEALLLVGQKRLLYDLGVEDVSGETSLAQTRCIKSNRRMLFLLAEKLITKEAAQLVSFLQREQVLVHSPTLEVSLLDLMVKRKSEELCSPIHAALQSMERGDLLTHFLSLGSSSSNPCPCSLHTELAASPPRDFPETDYFKQGRGFCVIVNQKTFTCGLQDRLGTDMDRDELAATFTLFDAELMVTDNLPAERMKDYLSLAARKANDPSFHWVSVCILSHGRRRGNVDEILGCDGQGVDRNLIVSMFACARECPHLHRKPKLFIFQACRSIEETLVVQHNDTSTKVNVKLEVGSDSGGAVPIVNGWPGLSDYMIASSTIPNFVSFRSMIYGSFYIRHLCKALQDKGHKEHIADILTVVNSMVMGYRTDFPSVPEFSSNLSKKFQLRRTKESTIRGVEMMARNKMFYIMLEQFVESQDDEAQQQAANMEQ